MIVVEGADNSGKTTLIGKIKERFPQLEPRKGLGPKNNYAFWIKSLKVPPEELARTVWDRFYFSELVYGTVARGRVNLTRQQKEVIESLLLACQPLVIHCRLIKQRELFEARPQLFEWEMMERIDNYYHGILEGWSETTYWPGQTDYDAIHPLVHDYLIKAGKWLEFRRTCPYGRGNPNQPQLMVVGEKFGPNNPLGIPMERSKTGVMVHNTLRANNLTMRDVWITNAIKYEGNLNTKNLTQLMAEWKRIQPGGIIALGKRAAGILSTLRIPHIYVRHPGFYMRKGKQDLFEPEFKLAWETLKGGNSEPDRL